MFSLTRLFNKILMTKKCWMNGEEVLYHFYMRIRDKGDIQNYTNYRGIKLTSHTMKL